MKRPPRRKPYQISVRSSTFDKLKELARKNREHLSTTLDAIIRAYLDQERR